LKGSLFACQISWTCGLLSGYCQCKGIVSKATFLQTVRKFVDEFAASDKSCYQSLFSSWIKG
jgi:hypothetical protein